jgi:hypothetical protein
MQGAHEAVRAQDIERVVECLSTAVSIYEQHPSCVHEPTSQLRDLLVLIRSARSLSNTLKRPENNLLELEEGRKRFGSRRCTERRSNENGAP